MTTAIKLTEQILKKYVGRTAAEAAEELGVSIATVSNWRKIFGLSEPKGNVPLSPKTINAIVQLAMGGVSPKDIAVQIGSNIATVRKYLYKEGIPLSTKGSREPLPEETKSKMRELKNKGYSGAEIARKLGVSNNVVYKYTRTEYGGGKYSPEEVKRLIEKHNFNMAAVGREIGVHRAYVSQIARQNGVWEWYHDAKEKFKKDLPKRILRMHERGMSINEISLETGKPILSVTEIIQRQTSRTVERIKKKR